MSEEVLVLADRIKPILANHRPEVQSAVLAELLSIWLAGHFIPGDENETQALREELLTNHCALVRELTKVNAEIQRAREATK
jgi:hypothetical protein